jgi:peptide/nickel transport system permease protein
MAAYMTRRLLQSVVVIIGVTFVAFSVLFLSGDPTYLLLGQSGGLSEEQVDQFRRQMGFDRPIIVQYLDYMSGVVRGDLGKSYYHGVPNLTLIIEFMPATLQLGLTALLISLVVGIPVGIIAATHRGTIIDHISMMAALVGQSMPVFWLGLLLILLFSVELKWFPVSGQGTWQHLVLPAITLASYSMALVARMVRSSMLETLSNDYIRTARAKGLSEWRVLSKHALKNAMIPVITLVGLQIGFLLGGSVITETIFAWPGMGRLVVQAINTKDIPLVQASVIVFALIFVGVNLLVDLSYAYLDPRIRLSSGPARR